MTDDKLTRVHLDFTSNALKIPKIREIFEQNLEQELKAKVPKIIDRRAEFPTHMTEELRFYLVLLDQGKHCYEFGLFHAAVSMIGLVAERFSIELAEKLQFTVNNNPLSKKEIFNRPIKQFERLRFLKKAKLISEEAYRKLEDIRIIRNKYVHPDKEEDAEIDSLKILKLFIEIINSRFSEKYKIEDGKLKKR